MSAGIDISACHKGLEPEHEAGAVPEIILTQVLVTARGFVSGSVRVQQWRTVSVFGHCSDSFVESTLWWLATSNPQQ
jgi:hypothetical protein